uniref:Nef protein n=1 Tax=Simian immunodeficiency virus TaxID=11723 RepID=Q88105_SIV|nr:nef [Simian immunodeficiency virus]
METGLSYHSTMAMAKHDAQLAKHDLVGVGKTDWRVGRQHNRTVSKSKRTRREKFRCLSKIDILVKLLVLVRFLKMAKHS